MLVNRRLLAVTLAAACLVAGVLVTPGLAQSNRADRFLRGLYNDPARFARLDGAAQSALERKFGFKAPHTLGARPTGVSPLEGGTAVNNNAADTTAQDTQSETTLIAFGKTVVVGYNDSGSCLPSCGSSANSDHFSGYARSTDSGRTFTDLGKLPNSTSGDAGDPQLAVDRTNHLVYYAALGFTQFNVLPVFKSTDGGLTFGSTPANASPGWGVGNEQDKEWMTVDNFAGPGQGTVYVAWTRFGSSTDIRLTHSTDQGATFGPSQGVLISSGTVQGSYVAVGPDHSVYVFWLNGSATPQK